MRPNVLTIFLLFAQVLSVHISVAIAAPPKGSLKLGFGNIFQTSSGGKLYACGNLPPWTPGRLVSEMFLPTKTEIKNLNKSIKKAKSSSKKKSLKKKVKSLTSYLSKATNICAAGIGTSDNFDAQGNVTAVGKSKYGIPSYMSANLNAGIAAWNQTCKSCHNTSPRALSLKSFPAIRQRIPLTPMNFSVPGEVSLQQIADIVAYANY